MSWSQEDAQHFVDHEHAFRLGALPTEQPHPVTRQLSQTLQRDVTAGLRLLAQVDRDIPPAARRVFAGAAFASLAGQLERAMRQGRRIFFTGCGATGRLAILMESAWRRFWQRARNAGLDIPGIGEMPKRVVSVMAGGDFALIRSVEGFEDYPSFGRHQLSQAGVSEGDVVVAVSEGGETSFVIGTAWEGLDRGASVFFVFNNPADTLAGLVERSRQVIEDPRITKLDLHSGPMAVAGSTRMQATTVELLVLAAAMESALATLLADQPGDLLARLGLARRNGEDYVRQLDGLLDQLAAPEALEAMAGLVKLEEHIYRSKGLVTYFAQEYLLDILTDTTERSPTFALPPFRPGGDNLSPLPWAFVKNLRLPTPQAWEDLLGHRPRGLDWDAEVYRRLEAPRQIVDAPPEVSTARIYAFGIGDEDDPSRRSKSPNAAVALLAGRTAADPELARRFKQASAAFDSRAVLAIGASPPADLRDGERLHVPCNWPDSPLDLWAHLAVKLVLNTLSTATMGRMKRLDGNWMIYVQPGNKKLIDRSCRLISTLAEVDYAQACKELFAVKAHLEREPDAFGDAPAPAAIAMRRQREFKTHARATDWNRGEFRLETLRDGKVVGRYPALERLPGIVALTTTANCGCLREAHRGEDAQSMTFIREALGVDGIAWVKHVHGTTVLKAAAPGRAGDGDGVVTAVPNLAVMSFSGDCVDILIADPVRRAAGAIHCGWKGTAERGCSSLVAAMKALGCNPADLVACIAPSIGPCCFSSWAESTAIFRRNYGALADRFLIPRGGRLSCDLWMANSLDLQSQGVLAHNVHIAGLCSSCNTELFPSHQRTLGTFTFGSAIAVRAE